MTAFSSSDVLIIGAGLAGCCLAAEFEERGLSFLLLDDPRKASATVAGGVINPVSGKRFGSDPQFRERRALAESRYRKLGDVWRDIDILRVLDSVEEQRHFDRKSASLLERELVAFVDEREWGHRIPAALSPFPEVPVVRFPGAAVVHCTMALRAFHLHYQECNQLEFVSTQDANHAAEHLSWHGIAFDRVVYCEGWRLTENPYFNYLPTMFAKGQVLEVESDALAGLRDILVRNSKFLLPSRGHQALFGASYEWNDLSDVPSEEGTRYLREALKNCYSPEFRILESRAGVRPIVRDLQPVVGAHPQYTNRYIFNGLGSKGALLAPVLARELALHMVENKALNPTESVRRFDAVFETVVAENSDGRSDVRSPKEKNHAQ